jgi:hypothetical protein
MALYAKLSAPGMQRAEALRYTETLRRPFRCIAETSEPDYRRRYEVVPGRTTKLENTHPIEFRELLLWLSEISDSDVPMV